MKISIIILIVLVLSLFYFLAPVPYCKITSKQIANPNAVYSVSEISELTNISVIMLNVKGTSMLPTIQDNSECLCVGEENYFIGDIIFFFANISNEWKGISHRINNIEGNLVTTKGDNNNWTDPPFPKENIKCMIPYIPRFKTLS